MITPAYLTASAAANLYGCTRHHIAHLGAAGRLSRLRTRTGSHLYAAADLAAYFGTSRHKPAQLGPAPYITLAAARELLSCSRSTLWRLIARGVIRRGPRRGELSWADTLNRAITLNRATPVRF